MLVLHDRTFSTIHKPPRVGHTPNYFLPYRVRWGPSLSRCSFKEREVVLEEFLSHFHHRCSSSDKSQDIRGPSSPSIHHGNSIPHPLLPLLSASTFFNARYESLKPYLELHHSRSISSPSILLLSHCHQSKRCARSSQMTWAFSRIDNGQIHTCPVVSSIIEISLRFDSLILFRMTWGSLPSSPNASPRAEGIYRASTSSFLRTSGSSIPEGLFLYPTQHPNPWKRNFWNWINYKIFFFFLQVNWFYKYMPEW